LLFMVNFVWRISFTDFHEVLLLWEESKTTQYFILNVRRSFGPWANHSQVSDSLVNTTWAIWTSQ
jgi:hypothetical protein